MRRMFNHIGRLRKSMSLVLLVSLALAWLPGAACAPRSALTPVPAYPIAPTLTATPPATPTRGPLPTVPPTATHLPKPTPAPTLTPTVTPVPTPLPLPPSAFYAVWAESSPSGLGQPWGVIWLADPRDIGSRREVVRFDKEEIFAASLSPDGRQIAFTAAGWKQGASPLWVVNLDGTGLRQVAPDAGQILWSQDGRGLFYNLGGERWVGIERVDLASGEKQRLLTIEPPVPLELLGMSNDGRQVYYVRQSSEGRYEIQAIGQDGRDAHVVTLLDPGASVPLFSPDGFKLLIKIPIPERPSAFWISTDGRTRQNLSLPSWRQWCGLIWSPNTDEAVLCQADEQNPVEDVYILNLRTGAKRTLGSFKLPPGNIRFSPVALSPDVQWMIISAGGGHYWIHLSTTAMVPVPREGPRVLFVAWVPRGVVGR